MVVNLCTKCSHWAVKYDGMPESWITACTWRFGLAKSRIRVSKLDPAGLAAELTCKECYAAAVALRAAPNAGPDTSNDDGESSG